MRAKEDGIAEPKAKPCRPHGWKTPEPGDAHLVCETCDRRLSFRDEMTTFKYVSIVSAYEDRNGRIAGERFRATVLAAWAAAGGEAAKR